MIDRRGVVAATISRCSFAMQRFTSKSSGRWAGLTLAQLSAVVPRTASVTSCRMNGAALGLLP